MPPETILTPSIHYQIFPEDEYHRLRGLTRGTIFTGLIANLDVIPPESIKEMAAVLRNDIKTDTIRSLRSLAKAGGLIKGGEKFRYDRVMDYCGLKYGLSQMEMSEGQMMAKQKMGYTPTNSEWMFGYGVSRPLFLDLDSLEEVQMLGRTIDGNVFIKPRGEDSTKALDNKLARLPKDLYIGTQVGLEVYEFPNRESILRRAINFFRNS